MTRWGLLSELVKRDRIKVSIAAWAYEFNHRLIMTDAAYDSLSQQVQTQINIATGNHRMDRFFQRHFTAHSGLWIHEHPNIPGLANIYARYYHSRKRR